MTTLTGQDMRSADMDRAHLEANMASALALQSPEEYQQWLLTYVRYLTRSKSCPSSVEKLISVQSERACCDTSVPDLLSWAVLPRPVF